MRNSIIIGSCKFFIVFFLLVIIGCSKSTNTTPAPTPPPDPPPTPTNPVLVVNRPDTAWYNGNVLVTFSATNANKITVDGVVVTTGQFLVQGITSPVTLTIVAYDSKGASDTKTVIVPVYSSTKTYLINTGRWSATKKVLDGAVMPPSSFCFHLTFKLNGTVTFHGSICGLVDTENNPFILSDNEQTLTFLGNVHTIQSISANTLILTTVTNGKLLVWTMEH